jgi:hypothetical protein
MKRLAPWLALVVTLALLLGLVWRGGGLLLVPSTPLAPGQRTPPAPAGAPQQTPDSSTAPIHAEVQNPSLTAASPSVSPSDAADPAASRAEEEISAIVSLRGISHAEAARRLLVLAQNPATPMEQRAAALQNGLMLADDAHYSLVRPLLEDVGQEPKLVRLLMRDLHERGDKVKLPALLALVLQESHPLHEEARGILGFLLAADHGRDPAAWRTAVAARLSAGAGRP